MQQLTWVSRGKLEWWDVPTPRIQSPLAALLRPVAAARCDLDLAMIYGRAGLAQTPFAFGHEFVADVVEIGDDVRTVKPGDRVLVSFQISCGICAPCRLGASAACLAAPPRAAYGMAPVSGVEYGGAFSDFVVAPFADAMLKATPKSLPLASLVSASDNLPDGLRAVMPHLAARPGAEVLVVGGGAISVGLYAAASAIHLGAGRVVYADHDRTRLDTAAAFGATCISLPQAIESVTLGAFPITVDASAQPGGLASALLSTTPFGVCTSVGIYFTPTTAVPLGEMYWKGITFITARVNSANALAPTLNLLAAGTFNPLIAAPTETVKWDDAAEALLAPATKLVLVRDPLP